MIWSSPNSFFFHYKLLHYQEQIIIIRKIAYSAEIFIPMPANCRYIPNSVKMNKNYTVILKTKVSSSLRYSSSFSREFTASGFHSHDNLQIVDQLLILLHKKYTLILWFWWHNEHMLCLCERFLPVLSKFG